MAKRTCSIDGCERPTRTGAAEWCNSHYARWQRTGDPTSGPPLPTTPRRRKSAPKPRRLCSIDGCTRPVEGYGWCKPHYRSWKRHGDPLAANFRLWDAPIVDRLWFRTDKAGTVPTHRPELGPCWLWRGSLNEAGYGLIFDTAQRRPLLVHRLSYETLVGPIPEGLHLDHLCRTRSCLNPTHLEPVTAAENNRRAALINNRRGR